MHRWQQPTGPLCPQMNLRKVLNWHGFMLGCSVDRTLSHCLQERSPGSPVVHRNLPWVERYCPIAAYVCELVCVHVCECARTSLTGCLSQLHHRPRSELLKRLSTQASPSAIFSRLKAGRAQKSQVPGQIKQVSARVSSLNPKKHPATRQHWGREGGEKKKKLQAPCSGQHREE